MYLQSEARARSEASTPYAMDTVIMLGNAKDFLLRPNALVLHEALANPLLQCIRRPTQLPALSVYRNNLSIPIPPAWDFGQRKLWVCLPLFHV